MTVDNNSQIFEDRKMKYDLIYADPPWAFKSNSKLNPGRNVRKEYKTMKPEEIATLNVKHIAAKDSMLIMWVTSPVLHKFPMVMNSWGFKYKGSFVAWIKTNKDGTYFRGMGYHTRKNMELCVYGTRGKGIGVPANRSQGEIQEWEEIESLTAGRHGLQHSEKPKEMYDLIEFMYPQAKNKIELFGRNHRKDWHVWGNDPNIDNDVELNFTSSLSDYF